MQKGDIITIIGLNAMAMCNRAEFRYHSLINGQHAVTNNIPGSRKKFVMPNIENTHNDRLTFTNTFPFQIQGERKREENGMVITRLMGDCLIRIYGTPDEIRTFITNHNLNTNFTRYDAVMALDDEDNCTPVYPEVPTNSHPVQTVRDKLNK